MIDEGLEDPGQVVAIGNFHHGSYDSAAGFRSRAGVAIPSLAGKWGAVAALRAGRPDAHLVDFGLPAVSTPAGDAAQGLTRWNRAVLFGADKHYSVAGGVAFGPAGWPYRCADGTVWHLRATMPNDTTLEIRAGRLTRANLAPDQLLLSVAVSRGSLYWFSRLFCNFSPDGTRAAIHRYVKTVPVASDDYFEARPGFIVELAVSGGSAAAPPELDVETHWTTTSALLSETLTPITDTHYAAASCYEVSPGEWAWSTTAAGSSGEQLTSELLVAVAYGSANDRQQITRRRIAWSNAVHTLSAPGAFGTVTVDYEEDEVVELRRNGATLSSVSGGGRGMVEKLQPFTDAALHEWSSWIGTGDYPVVWLGGSSYQKPMATVRAESMCDNVIALVRIVTSGSGTSRSLLLGFVSASAAGDFAAGAGPEFGIAVDPVSGDWSPTTLLWF